MATALATHKRGLTFVTHHHKTRSWPSTPATEKRKYRMPKYKRGSGSVYLKRGWCYLKYYVNGKAVYEAAGTKNKAEARRLLNERLGEIAKGEFIDPTVGLSFDRLIAGVLDEYRDNARKTYKWVDRRTALHLRPFFGHKKAQDITTDDAEAFIGYRKEQGASNGEINRELAVLKRAFTLAVQRKKLRMMPYLPRLKENNVRKGFFEPWEFTAVLAKLPECLRPPFTFAYQTGWRMLSEVLRLIWQQVNLDEGTVRLEPGTTKNGEGRLIYLTRDLRALLEGQWRERQQRYPQCSWVFHDRGRKIANYYKRWHRACQEAGLVGRIPHDFRRTAVRNMVRAGIPERVAMQISGHKTRAVFDRYHIVSDRDLQEAARRLESAFPAANGDHFGDHPTSGSDTSFVSH